MQISDLEINGYISKPSFDLEGATSLRERREHKAPKYLLPWCQKKNLDLCKMLKNLEGRKLQIY